MGIEPAVYENSPEVSKANRRCNSEKKDDAEAESEDVVVAEATVPPFMRLLSDEILQPFASQLSDDGTQSLIRLSHRVSALNHANTLEVVTEEGGKESEDCLRSRIVAESDCTRNKIAESEKSKGASTCYNNFLIMMKILVQRILRFVQRILLFIKYIFLFIKNSFLQR